MKKFVSGVVRWFLPEGAARLVAGVVVMRDGKILIVQEGRRHKRMRWELPGGRVGASEPLLDAARREVREETGLEVKLTGICGIYRRESTLRSVVRFVFIAEVIGGSEQVDGKEIVALRWLTVDELSALPDDQLLRPGQMRAIIRDLRKGNSLPLELLNDC